MSLFEHSPTLVAVKCQHTSAMHSKLVGNKLASLSRDKPVLLGEILRLLDEPLAHTDSHSSVSDVIYAQEEVLIHEA
jgi:hypothetical protein